MSTSGGKILTTGAISRPAGLPAISGWQPWGWGAQLPGSLRHRSVAMLRSGTDKFCWPI